MKLKRLLLLGVPALLILYLVLAFLLSKLIMHPRRLSMEQAEELIKEKWDNSMNHYLDQLVKPQDILVASEVDQIKLSGWYFKQPDTTRCGVVMAHGWNNSRTGVLKYASIFWDCGCDLVMYDHRGHGSSEGSMGTGGILEAKDLITITSWLQEKTGLRNEEIAWFGESWGGATVLQAGAYDKDVAFIVADSPFQNWHTAVFERADKRYGVWLRWLFGATVTWMVELQTGIEFEEASALLAAPDIVEPVFINHSMTDTKTGSQQSINIAQQLRPETSMFHHADWGGDHCKDVILRPDEYKQLVRGFMQRQAGTFGSCR
ncbi:MAG: alpha/beta hydrolase [Saprospiraceae bacterium]|nr:alpha/beta hydrolase [Saprospiraceae bacterium]